MGKDFKVEISWKHLESIARYYEFPSAVFLGDGIKLKGTRKDSLNRKLIKVRNEINEIVGD